MEVKSQSAVVLCYECCRFLIRVLDSEVIEDSDKEIAAMMLKEKFEQLGKMFGILE